MSKESELKALAKLIYKLTRREVWLGGQGSKDWPKGIGTGWGKNVFWSLSPEVELKGHRYRVSVASNPYNSPREDYYNPESKHPLKVEVYVDGELKYPGGSYVDIGIKGWDGRLAKMERTEGGKTGHVWRRDLVLKAAKWKLFWGTPLIKHTKEEAEPKLVEELGPPDPLAEAAIREVENLGKSTSWKKTKKKETS